MNETVHSTAIHPTAVIDPAAELGEGVTVGPYAVVGAGVTIGEGTSVGAGAVIQGTTSIGRDNKIFPHAAIGFDPQDLKYDGEPTRLEIGDRNHFREFCTIQRGTGFGGGVTSIGDDNLFMVYSHVAHDCHVGSRCILVNNGTLGGHVEVSDDATIGAFASVHQFTRVGRHAYIGGYTVLTMDALPFAKTVGAKPACYGLNTIGLQRKGFSSDVQAALKTAFRLLTRSKLNASQALERIRADVPGVADVDYLVEFVESSERGVVKTLPGARSSRGGG